MGLRNDDETLRDQTELGAEFASDDCSLNKAEGPMQDIREGNLHFSFLLCLLHFLFLYSAFSSPATVHHIHPIFLLKCLLKFEVWFLLHILHSVNNFLP
jgi:hypothetical protein